MFDLEPEEARLLLNIALMAAGRNRFGSCAKILALLEMFRPGHVSLASAKAVALINARNYTAALAFLEGEALREHPDSAMLKAFKGMALLRLARVSEAQELLQEVSGQTEDIKAANLAKELLND